MTKIDNVSYISEFESKYQKGMEISYELNGEKRVGEFNLKMGSVSILLFDTEKQAFLLVRQFRPAIFTKTISCLPENHGKDLNEIDWKKYDPEIGHTMELCAGLIDKTGLTPEEIAREEISEECGYNVAAEKLVPISNFIVGAHQSGNSQFMYYAEIDSSLKISEGGGNVHEGEIITKVYLPIEVARKLIYPENDGISDVKGPPGVLFALQWWFLRQKIDFSSKRTSKLVWKVQNAQRISNLKFSSEFDKKKYGYDPKRMIFSLNGCLRSWDLALCQNTSTCIVVDSSTREAVFLQTFRIPVLIGRTRFSPENLGKPLETLDFESSNPEWAYTLELPVIHVPEGDDPRKFGRLAIEKIGYEVEEEKLKYLAKDVPGIGQSGDSQFTFFVDLKNAKKVETLNNLEIIETRIPFSSLIDLYHQTMIGPPNVYVAIGYIIDKFVINN